MKSLAFFFLVTLLMVLFVQSKKNSIGSKDLRGTPVENENVSGNNIIDNDDNYDDIRKIIIIDTDAGWDDGVAILNLLSAEELGKDVKTLFITTVHGNTDEENVCRNVLKILKTMNRLDIPIFRGSSESLLSSPKIENSSDDGFGNFDFSDAPPIEYAVKDKAVNALVEAVSANPGRLTLVCLGPLTNVALAAKLDSNFLKNLKEVFVLGGTDSGVGNIKPGVEFNFFMDSAAAFMVLKEAEKIGKILNLVSLETSTLRTKVDMNWRKNVLGALNTPQVDLINKIEMKQLNGHYWASADTVLSSIVLDGNLVESAKDYHATVETCGEIASGAMFLDRDPGSNLVKNVRLIERINGEKHKMMLLENFNGRGGQGNGASRMFRPLTGVSKHLPTWVTFNR